MFRLKIYSVIFLSSISFNSYNVFCQEIDQAEYLIKQSEAKQLSLSQEWHKLLHYKSSKTKTISDVKSDDFFFSDNGRFDSKSELHDTIKAMLDQKFIGNNHAQCRFPARYKWLKNNLQWPEENLFDSSECVDYNKWKMKDNIKSISLIFASGHLSNPASFYGHMLLKFNSKNEQNELSLLDSSLNYGAVPPENENAFIYVVKGLTGGYNASFTNQQFYRYNHTYAENDLRDLWNYELDLSQNQINLLIDHSWELLGQEFTYYFLKQNCGYRMAELLNMVIEEPLLPTAKNWAMPSDLLSKLVNETNHGKKLIKKITLIKSRQNSFRDKFALLSDEEKQAVSKFIFNKDLGNLPSILENEINSNKKVIDTLLDYYAFSLTKKKADRTDIETRRRFILLSRLKLDTKDIEWPSSIPKSPPHESQNSSLLQTSLVHNNKLGTGIELRFRGAYYDYLSNNSGRSPFTQMSMLDLTMIYQQNKISLKQLDLIHVETLNISPTRLPEDEAYAWKVKAGVKKQNLSCEGCLHGYISGGIGKGYLLNKKSAIYVMITGEANVFGEKTLQLNTGATAGFITGYNDWWKSHLEFGIQKSVTSSQKLRKIISWENRFSTSKWWDVRLKVKYDKATEIQIKTGYYW
ncbi:MAG: DUF4105 domain-containing protein [Emcibacteraceae bacterium]|nr:DUF4105 domain-containing protein [Emcibacteraceae bacterium]